MGDMGGLPPFIAIMKFQISLLKYCLTICIVRLCVDRGMLTSLFFTLGYCCWYENYRKLDDRSDKMAKHPNTLDNYFSKNTKKDIADGGQVTEQTSVTHHSEDEKFCSGGLANCSKSAHRQHAS